MPNPDEPQGSASEHTSAIEKGVEQIRHHLDKIINDARRLVNNANSNWFFLTPAVKWWISRKLREFQSALDRILKYATEVLAHHTPVLSLINISFHWLNAVKGPVSDLSPRIELHANRNLAFWEGATAGYYNGKVIPPQKAAVEALAAKAGFISEWLYSIAMSNVKFVTELSTMIGKIAGEIASAALESETVINIPWAIDRIAAAVGVLVETTINTLLGIVDRIVTAGENVRKIVSDRVDNTKFPGGAWPQSVAG